MKLSKEARKLSRQLLRMSFSDGKLDRKKIASMVNLIAENKPRHYLEALKEYQHLVRLEVEKKKAIIESATPLNRDLGERLVKDLKKRYGDDLSTEFQTNPELLGGLRIKIGDDVWDGSVKSRLHQLQEKL